MENIIYYRNDNNNELFLSEVANAIGYFFSFFFSFDFEVKNSREKSINNIDAIATMEIRINGFLVYDGKMLNFSVIFFMLLICLIQCTNRFSIIRIICKR